MADLVSGGSSNQPPKKEMSMEVRLLLAFLLMGAVMFLTPYLFKNQTPPPQPQKAEQTSAAPTPAQQPGQAQTPPQAAAAVDTSQAPAVASGPITAAVTVQQPQPALIIDTDKFRLTLNNQGATVRSWLLKGYKGNDGKPLEMVNTAA